MQSRLIDLGRREYLAVWRQMQQFTAARTPETPDEIWLVEHPPVFTLGLNGKREHILGTNGIPVVESDRGGQVTYHGPGQLVVYLLADLRRLKWGPRQLVTTLENAMICALAQYGLKSRAKADAPGVYIEDRKIGSVGLRIKNGCSYHGLSLNNNMDLAPFRQINPCGYPGMAVTQLADEGVDIFTHELAMPVIYDIIKAIET